MGNFPAKRPVVLVFAGHDPSGGAGIQADIESIGAAGCHALPVITALTTQNTRTFAGLIPQDPASVEKQTELLKQDFQIDACKIGMLGNARLIEPIAVVLSDLKIPAVFDPVLITGTGDPVADNTMQSLMVDELLPLCRIITPNGPETRTLAGIQETAGAADKLLNYGCDAVLVTGADEDTAMVTNRLYRKNRTVLSYTWERLAGVYHGSGCTLSASIAARLAHGSDLETAVNNAQKYTWHTLKHGQRLGRGALQPDRFIDF